MLETHTDCKDTGCFSFVFASSSSPLRIWPGMENVLRLCILRFVAGMTPNLAGRGEVFLPCILRLVVGTILYLAEHGEVLPPQSS